MAIFMSKKSVKTSLKFTLEVDVELKERLDKITEEAEKRGLHFDISAEIARVLAGQITRAERALTEMA